MLDFTLFPSGNFVFLCTVVILREIIPSWKFPMLIISYHVGNISRKSLCPLPLDTTPERNGLLSLQEASSEAQFYTKGNRLMLNFNEIR